MALYSTYNDEELLTLLQSDDTTAFDALYEKYHHALYLNVIRSVRSTMAAEDIIQETFYALWKKRHTIRADRPVGGWLFTVSYHFTVDYLRSKLKEQDAVRHLSEIMDSAGDARYTQEQYAFIEKAIQQLSPQKRKVFELCKLQGKTYESAATELGLSKYTVSEYLKEAMASIRQYTREQPIYSSCLISSALLSVFLQ